MASNVSPVSPKLHTLHQAVNNSRPDAVDAFWHELRARGAPLIEPIPDDPEHSLVTFLWRAVDKVENVVVVGDLAKWDFGKGQLIHLPDTDLWYKSYRFRNDLRTTYWLAPNDMLVPMEKSMETIPWDERTDTWAPDPLNPKVHVIPKHAEDPETADQYKSILELPNAPPQRWIEAKPGTPQGRLDLHRFHSDILDNERRVWVYTPPNYTSAGEPCHLLIHFDGQTYTSVIPTPTILDNLLFENRIPSTVAVLIDSPDMQTRNMELASHPPFADFLTQELMPWVRSNYHVTTKFEQTTVCGSSHGGQGAAYIGLRHPEIFGNVLAQSGSFWWKLEDGTAYEWLTDNYVTSEGSQAHFYLNMGTLENMSFFGQPTALDAVHSFHDILLANGYQIHYKEYSGGHDLICWADELANGLIQLSNNRGYYQTLR